MHGPGQFLKNGVNKGLAGCFVLFEEIIRARRERQIFCGAGN
jgi:hypothetical protein